MTEDILLTCPKCDAVLDKLTVQNVEVDLCDSCGGLWLDRGELAKLKFTGGDNAINSLQQLTMGHRSVPPDTEAVTLHCPACEGTLELLPVGKIKLDLCKKCQGMWLDWGELEPAMSALDEQTDPALLDTLMGLLPPRK